MAATKEARVRFSAETREFTEGIKNANSSLSALRAGLALNEAEFKNTGDAAQYLQNKQKILVQQMSANIDKQEALEGKLEAAKRIYGENSTETQNWERKLSQAKTGQERLETQLNETNEAIEEQKKAEEKAQSPIEQLNRKIEDQRDKLSELKTQYANTALEKGRDSDAARDLRNEIDQLNTELEQNEQQLRDVTDAANNAGNAAEKQAKGGWNSTKQIFSNLATGAISSLVGKLQEAAKAVINLGTEFTASLSNVQALSGATSGEMSRLENAAKELGRTTIFSAKDVSDAFGYMALAGWDVSDMLAGVDGVLNLAASAQMDLAKASDIVTDYLTAFGLGAEDAGKFVDQMAYAMSHSNTDVTQLGEAYKNVAATAGSMGYTVEDTTAALMTMANAGVKGSEAGTGLSSIMTRLATNTKGCADKLKEHGVEVYDSQGRMNTLSSILNGCAEIFSDLTDEEQANLAKTIAGQNQYSKFQTVMIGLSDAAKENGQSFNDYTQELEKCTGAASEMSDIMQDNLGGDMKALDSAMQGLGLQLFEYFEGPLRGAAQMATDAINWITDAITPTETALTRFIDSTQEAINTNRSAIEVTENKVNDITASIGELEIYKGTLIELLDKTEKNELEQFMLKDAIEQLSGSVPGLKEAYDEVNGTFKISNEEIIEMIDNAEALALKTALIEAKKETYKNYADAVVNAAMAEQGLKKATEEYNSTSERTYSGLDSAIGLMIGANAAVSDQSKAVQEASRAYQDANAELEKAREDMEVLPEAIEGLANEYGADLAGAADNAAESISGTGEAAAEAEEEIAVASELTEEEMEAVEKAAQAARDAFTGLRDGVQTAMRDAVTFMDEFNGGAQLSAEQMEANLDSTIQGVQSWADNMARLGAEAGGSMSQELYDKLLEMGPSSANIVQELVNTLDSDKEQFERIGQKYSESLNFAAKSDELAKYATAGKQLTGEMAKGISDGSDALKTAAQTSAEQTMVEIESKTKSGLEAANAQANAQFGAINATFATRLSGMLGTTSSYMGLIEASVRGMVSNISSILGQPIYGPNIKVPHFSITGDFNLETKSVPTVGVQWYAKGGIFTEPTIFNTPNGLKGVGEAGAEAVLPIDLLKDYISDAVSNVSETTINNYMEVNGAADPEEWATEFARSLKQQVRIG